MSDEPGTHISLVMDSGLLMDFFPLFQQGFNVRAQCGGTLEELLCSQWGIDSDYVTTRITTIFMNHRAIDSIATTTVHTGAVVALSGAMPGLVGATMRRGGYYAAMRGSMTHQDDTSDSGGGTAEIRVKLFNLLLPELGPAFLKRGLGIEAAQLATFFHSRDVRFWQGCRLVKRDGIPCEVIDAVGFCNTLVATDKVHLTVSFEG